MEREPSSLIPAPEVGEAGDGDADRAHAPAQVGRDGVLRRRLAGVNLRAWHVAGLLLLLAIGALLVYAFWPALTGQAEVSEREPVEAVGESVTQVGAVVVEPVSFPLRAEATGHLRPWRKARISAQANGLVTERPVEEGQYIEEGALLARLDDSDEQIAFGEAQAELLKAQALYAVNTRGDGVRTSADTTALAQERGRLLRAEAAYEGGLLTREELEAVRRRFEVAALLAGKRRGAVQAVTAGLTQAEQRVARAELALERTRVHAPFAGRVANLDVEVGQRVAAGEELLTLLADRRMKVDVDVLATDLVHVEEGADAWVHVPALDSAVFEGYVWAINPRVDPATGTGRVTVAISNPEGRLVSGLFARVELETRRLPDRLVVPAEAVLVRQGRDLVFVVEDGRAQWTYVQVGARSSGHVVITEGIQPGDTVAVDGHFALAHDAPVEVTAVGAAFEQ